MKPERIAEVARETQAWFLATGQFLTGHRNGFGIQEAGKGVDFVEALVLRLWADGALAVVATFVDFCGPPLLGHFFVWAEGKFYDAEAVEGVFDWERLPLVERAKAVGFEVARAATRTPEGLKSEHAVMAEKAKRLGYHDRKTGWARQAGADLGSARFGSARSGSAG